MASRLQVQTLHRSQDFLRLKEKGKRIHVSQWMLLSFSMDSSTGPYFGWTIPRFVGHAVVRNKLRRWLREFFRQQLSSDSCPRELELNVVIKRYDKEFFERLSYGEFVQVLDEGWCRLRKIT